MSSGEKISICLATEKNDSAFSEVKSLFRICLHIKCITFAFFHILSLYDNTRISLHVTRRVYFIILANLMAIICIFIDLFYFIIFFFRNSCFKLRKAFFFVSFPPFSILSLFVFDLFYFNNFSLLFFLLAREHDINSHNSPECFLFYEAS